MADAILHAQYMPRGVGGVSAGGKILLGPNEGIVELQNRFVVFDPASALATVVEVTLPIIWRWSSRGIPWNGGVVVAAGQAGGTLTTYVVVMYADNTYDVLNPGVNWTHNALFCEDPLGRLWMFRIDANVAPRIFTPSTGLWTNGSTNLRMTTQPILSGGLMWGNNASTVIGVDPSTGTVATTHAGVGSATGQAELLGGRYWVGFSSTVVRGVRLSDGDIRNVTAPATAAEPLAQHDGRLWRATSTQGFSIDPDTGDTVTYNHASALGQITGCYAAGGVVWATGINPTS